VLIGVRQLGERVHAMQLQLETWVETSTQYHGDEADVLQQLQEQLAAVRARIDSARVSHPAIDEATLTPSESLTTQFPEE